MVQVRQGLTLDEFLALPEEKPSLEYHEGRVTQKGAPLGKHSVLQTEFVEFLNQRLRPAKIARAFPELRTTYDASSRVPDVAVYLWHRIPRTPARQVDDRFLTPPDLAVEIISPGETVRELVQKCEWYVGHGVRVALLVTVRDESIRAFRPGQTMRIHRRGEQIELQEIAPGLQIDVDTIFRALDAD